MTQSLTAEHLRARIQELELELIGDEHHKGLRRELAFWMEVAGTWKERAKKAEAERDTARELWRAASKFEVKLVDRIQELEAALVQDGGHRALAGEPDDSPEWTI